MRVIGTAGHIDHGKTALVGRLTGIDTDRLDEEKRRGMTIDLGFAWLTLPSGLEVGIVDVPGHERFVKNMVAGAGGIDIALLVVAADDGVMPQTREHLAILDLLGISRCVTALTKSDLVDAEMLDLARDDVRRALAGTAFASSPLIPVSSVTGMGVTELLQALDVAAASIEGQFSLAVPYLPIDRVFSVDGFGTVATGTLHGSALEVGQEVEILPAGERGRIRALQVHRRHTQRVEPNSRIAVNLVSDTRRPLQRGDVLSSPGSITPVRRIDASVRVPAGSPVGLRQNLQATFHAGTAERQASVRILGDDFIYPDGEGWIQVRLDQPTPLVKDQPFILRLPSPARTVAGGRVLDLAPHPRRSASVVTRRLERLASASPAEALQGLMSDGYIRTGRDIGRSLSLEHAASERLLADAVESGTVVAAGDNYVAADSWIELRRQASEILAAFHQEHPLRRGVSRDSLRRSLRVPAQSWPQVLNLLIAAGTVQIDGSSLTGAGWIDGLDQRGSEMQRILKCLQQNPYDPPTEAELLRTCATDLDVLSAMVRQGRVVRVAPGMYFDREAYDRMVCAVLVGIEREGAVTVAMLRDSFATSRKYVLAFLEHLDAERITRRVGDARVRGSRGSPCVSD